MAQVVYTRAAAGSDVRGDLFEGLRFFIAQRCPSRATYVDKVVSNGGQVVKLEAQADLLIADDVTKKTHLNPAGAISYKFIDDSIRRGTLADVEDEKYKAGPAAGEARPVGSQRPGKFGRTPFTLADKIQLYEFVQSYADKGGSVRGNEIYKQLEALNNRHTYQAWRDHYIKQLQGRPHPGNGGVRVQQTAPPTPPVEQPPDLQAAVDEEDLYGAPPPHRPPPMTTSQARRQRRDSVPANPPQPALRAPGFSAVDIHDLLVNADDILDTRVRHEAAAWQAWTNDVTKTSEPGAKVLSPNEWKLFWQNVVYPLYKEHEDDKRRTKIYNKAWLAWSDMNQGATADEWLDYYELVVKPLLENDEHPASVTPAKSASSQMYGAHVSVAASRAGEADPESEAGQRGKRPYSHEEGSDNNAQATTPSKRQRLQAPGHLVQPPVHETGSAQLNPDASIHELINVYDDDVAEELEMPDTQVPPTSASRPDGVIPSSPPPTAGTGNSKEIPIQDTQAILAEIQDIDFEIPEPEGGFDYDELYPDLPGHESMTSSQVDPLGHEIATRATAEEENNATIDADPPMGMPGLTEVDSVGAITKAKSESTNNRTTTRPQAPADYPPLEVRAAMLNIEALVRSGRDQLMIQEAAFRTSADPQLFRLVLRNLESGRGVPKSMRGVWTAGDDEVVQGSDARGLQRLEFKHGSQGLHSVEGRLDFLREYSSE